MKKNNSSSKKPPQKKETNKNGKGDSPRNNITKIFRNNYDSISWKTKKK